MGTGYKLRCPSCGYAADIMLGVGFFYSMVYMETMESARSGKLGEDLKQFLVEHPNGVINPELRLVRCEKCGEYSSVPDLTMYLPRKDANPKRTKGRWSVAVPATGMKYVYNFDEYDVYKPFQHRCGKCQGKAVILHDPDVMKLECPHCKGRFLKIEEAAMWD